jgi:hypothetical protein
MAWIEAHQTLRNHPKLGRLARRLGVSKPQAAGHLVFLWFWATDYCDDGDLTGFEAVEVAEAADWQEDPDAFVSALIDSGFIDASDDGSSLHIHDWQDYGGKLAAQRKANAERQRKHREQRAERDVTESSQPRTRDVTVTSPLRNGATVQNSTVPNPFANAHATRARAHDAQDLDFDRFCAEYPPGRIGSKTATRAAFDLAVDADGALAIFNGLAAWNACGQWQRGYVTKAETWLTDRNYAQAPPKDRPKVRTKKSDKPEPFIYPVERQ